jgi:hypothetical protein
MDASIESVKYRIDDASRPVNRVQGRSKSLIEFLVHSLLKGVLIRDPACVDAIHVDPVLNEIRRRSACHHIQRGFGHIGVWVASRLEISVELALHRGNVYYVLVP